MSDQVHNAHMLIRKELWQELKARSVNETEKRGERVTVTDLVHEALDAFFARKERKK
jgi:hypothetical protein